MLRMGEGDMKFFTKSTKEEVITSIVILLWIFAVNLITPMITTAPAWPMFFVTIFSLSWVVI